MRRPLRVAIVAGALMILAATMLIVSASREVQRLIDSGACRPTIQVPGSLSMVWVCLASNAQGYCTMSTLRESLRAETYWTCETGQTFWRATED